MPGSSDDAQVIGEDLNEWGPKFERLNTLFGHDAAAAQSDTDDDSDYEFPPIPAEAARRYRKARFASVNDQPRTGSLARNIDSSMSRGGMSSPHGYDRLRDVGGSAPYHETINPLADVYDRDGGGGGGGTNLESWC